MNYLVLGLLLVAICPNTTFGMTREQLKKTLTMTKKQCMPKTGVTEDKVGRIEQGVFIEEKNVMCYVTCIYKTIQVVFDARAEGKQILYLTRAVINKASDGIVIALAFGADVKYLQSATFFTLSPYVKNEKLNKDMVAKQIDILYPPDMKAAVKKSVAKCIDVQEKYSTECERVFYAVKCLYEDNPSNFVFP